MRELTIIIPAYNEEKGIANTIVECVKHNKDAEIIVVDDCSTDNTNRIVQDMQKKYSQLKLIRNSKNKNYGGALKVGYKNFTTKYMAFIDADMTYLPSYIPKLLAKLKQKKLDVVWGSRFSREKKSYQPMIRKVGNRILKVMFVAMTGKYIPDVCSGMRVFTREGIEKISYKTLPNGLDMISAMSKRIIKRNLKYATMPISYPRRVGGSKLNLVTDFFHMSKNIIVEK